VGSSYLSHLSSTCFNLVINPGTYTCSQKHPQVSVERCVLCSVGLVRKPAGSMVTTLPHVLYPFVLAWFDDKLERGLWDEGGADGICGSLVGLTGVYLSFVFLLLVPYIFYCFIMVFERESCLWTKDLYGSWCVFVFWAEVTEPMSGYITG